MLRYCPDRPIVRTDSISIRQAGAVQSLTPLAPRRQIENWIAVVQRVHSRVLVTIKCERHETFETSNTSLRNPMAIAIDHSRSREKNCEGDNNVSYLTI